MITTQDLKLKIVSGNDCGELHIEQNGRAVTLRTMYPQNPDCPMIILSRDELRALVDQLTAIIKLTEQ